MHLPIYKQTAISLTKLGMKLLRNWLKQILPAAPNVKCIETSWYYNKQGLDGLY